MSNQRVILYGFGWVGQSIFALCEALGLECLVVDEALDKNLILHNRLVGIEIFKEPFALCLITLNKREHAQKLRAKLQALGVGDSLLRHISSYDYRQSMAYLLPDFFGSAQSLLALWQSEPFELPQFHTKLAELVATHRKNRAVRNKDLLAFRTKIDTAFPARSVFAKMFNTGLAKGRLSHIPYPGFNASIAIERADENFYFEKFDWDYARNRPANVKLIACFGNSALRLNYLPLAETLVENLRKELQKRIPNQKFLIINLGISGYTIYEQLMLYNALIYPLAPELVISFFGGTDWRTGIVSDSVLLKKHKITYTPGYSEYHAKAYLQKHSPLDQFPLYTELETPNPEISDDDVNTAIATRLRQFHAIVCGGGGQICCFYPTTIAMQKGLDKRGTTNAA